MSIRSPLCPSSVQEAVVPSVPRPMWPRAWAASAAASRRSAALAYVSTAAVAAACGRSQGAGPRPGAVRALTVRVAPVVAQDVVYEIKAPGTMEAEELVQITAQVEGAATAVHFHEGDRV